MICSSFGTIAFFEPVWLILCVPDFCAFAFLVCDIVWFIFWFVIYPLLVPMLLFLPGRDFWFSPTLVAPIV